MFDVPEIPQHSIHCPCLIHSLTEPLPCVRTVPSDLDVFYSFILLIYREWMCEWKLVAVLLLKFEMYTHFLSFVYVQFVLVVVANV